MNGGMAGRQYIFSFTADLRDKASPKMKRLEQRQERLMRTVGKGVGVTKRYSTVWDKSGKSVGKATTFINKQDGVVRKITKTVDKSGQSTYKYSKTMDTATKSAQGFGAGLVKIMGRALLTIPVWLLLRTVFMGIIRTISDSIRAFVDLDDQLARIRTVMHGSAESIEIDMALIRSQILETSVDSRIAMKELAEGFYFLKTAGLDTEEAMAGFEATVNLAIGTNNNMAQSARAVAGVYNTMGKYLGDNLTVHEKFQHIADVLAYTYATQDVQLSELIESYTKMAPYITGLSDSFLELTTMLGFLNTRLLRGGRTGRLTGRAILQLTKNAQKLANIFGITFDPDKPIELLDTIKRIRDMMGKVGKLTAEQGQIIQTVFATRGGVAIRLLIEHFDDLNDQIKDAIEFSGGFAEKMKEIRMRTIAGQMERMKNILAVLTNTFLQTAYGARDLADMVRILNDNLVGLQSVTASVGKWFGDIGDVFRYDVYWIYAYIEAMKQIPQIATGGQLFIAPLADIRSVRAEHEKLWQSDWEGGRKTQQQIEEYLANQEKLKEVRVEIMELNKKYVELATKGKLEEVKKINERLKELEIVEKGLLPAEVQLSKARIEKKETENMLEEKGLALVDEAVEKNKHIVRLMKARGASALDIVRKELELLEAFVKGHETAKDSVNLLKLRNKIIEEELNYRNQLVNVFQKAELQMLKTMGASQLQILNHQEKQLIANRENKTQLQFMVEYTNIQLQRAREMEKHKRKELDLANNIYDAYRKANEAEKSRLRRMVELREFDPDKLARMYKESMYDQRVIDEYFRYFSTKQKDAITEAREKLYPFLKDIEIDIEPIEAPFFEIETLLPQDKIADYWREWTNLGKESADVFADYMVESLRGRLPLEELIAKLEMGREERKTPEELKAEVGKAYEAEQERFEAFAETMEGFSRKTIYETYRMMEKIVPTTFPQYRPGEEPGRLPKIAPEIKPTIERIEINIPEAVEEIADKVSRDVKEELLTNEEFAKRWLQRFRGYV